jgi:hypothetical protein
MAEETVKSVRKRGSFSIFGSGYWVYLKGELFPIVLNKSNWNDYPYFVDEILDEFPPDKKPPRRFFSGFGRDIA